MISKQIEYELKNIKLTNFDNYFLENIKNIANAIVDVHSLIEEPSNISVVVEKETKTKAILSVIFSFAEYENKYTFEVVKNDFRIK